MGSNDTKCRMMNTSQTLRAGTYVGEGVNENEVDSLVETLALASVGRRTQKVVLEPVQNFVPSGMGRSRRGS